MFIDKLVAFLISPLGTTLFIGCLACLFAIAKRTRIALVLAVFAIGWFWLWSTPVVSYGLRGSLESRYPAIDVQRIKKSQAIVVLGGGIRPPEQFQQLPDLNDGADRVWHAARLYHAHKAPRIVVSAGSDKNTSATTEAESMRVFLKDLGVPAEAIILEDESRNTRQNAEFCARILKKQNIREIILVTSALHMRRAEGLFAAQGLKVIPAATDHEARHRFSDIDWFPDANALDGSARAIKEIVGRAFGR